MQREKNNKYDKWYNRKKKKKEVKCKWIENEI